MNRWFVGHCGKDGDRTDRDIITNKLFLVNIWFGAATGQKKKKQPSGLRAHTICSQKNVAKAAVKRPNFNFGTSFNCVRCQCGKLFILHLTNQMWYKCKKLKNVLWLYTVEEVNYIKYKTSCSHAKSRVFQIKIMFSFTISSPIIFTIRVEHKLFLWSFPTISFWQSYKQWVMQFLSMLLELWSLSQSLWAEVLAQKRAHLSLWCVGSVVEY